MLKYLSHFHVHQLFWILSACKLIQFNDKLDKIKHALLKQTNFVRELDELTYFYNQYNDSENLEIPKPYPTLSNENILSMSYIEGHSISNIYDQEKQFVANNLWNLLSSAFVHGHWHADLHKGNIYKRKWTFGYH